MNTIMIPVYNDWASLSVLLSNINKITKNDIFYNILIIDDSSKTKPILKKKIFKRIKQIKILTLKKNMGNQIAIAIGLDYIKKNLLNSNIIVMDADGEDAPININKMLAQLKKNGSKIIITCNRTKRKENLIFQIAYKIHLIIVFIFTFNWISFGNFTCFSTKILKKINLENVYCAYSSEIKKNLKIKSFYAPREKRYFGASKVNFIKLIEHSLRIVGNFYQRTILISFFYICSINIFFDVNILSIKILTYFILTYCFLVIFFKKKYSPKEKIDYKNFVKKISIL